MKSKDRLLAQLRGGEALSASDQLQLTMLLAVPAILAQLSSVLMQYIDSAMVGRLGSNQAASVGLVSTTTWIMAGFAMAVVTGFSVQVAHACGAKEFRKAREIMRQGLGLNLDFSVMSLDNYRTLFFGENQNYFSYYLLYQQY